jgi:hypothetical protein
MTRAFMLKTKTKRKNKLKKTLCCTQADAHLRQYHKHAASKDFVQALGALKQAFLAFQTAGAKAKMNDIRALECRTRGDGLMQQSKQKLEDMEFEEYISHLEHARGFFKYYCKSHYYKRLQNSNTVAARTELNQDADRVASVRNIRANCLKLAQQRGFDSMAAASEALEPQDESGGRVSSDKLALVKEHHAAVTKSFSWLEKNGIKQPEEITNSIKELAEDMKSSKLQGQAAVVFQAMIRINIAKRAMEFNLFTSQLKKCKNYIVHRYLMREKQYLLEEKYLGKFDKPWPDEDELKKGLQHQEDLMVIKPLKLVQTQLMKYASRSRSMMPKMLFFMDKLQVIDQLVAALPLITAAHQNEKNGPKCGHKHHHHKHAEPTYDAQGHVINAHHHHHHHHKDKDKEHMSTPVAILEFLQCTAAVMPNTFNTKRQSFLSKQIMQHSPLARVFQTDAERRFSTIGKMPTSLNAPQTVESRPPRGDSIEDKWLALHPMATSANVLLKPEFASKMPQELVETVLSTVLAEGSVQALTVGVEVLQLMLKWNMNTATQTLRCIHAGGGTKVLIQVFAMVSTGNGATSHKKKERRKSLTIQQQQQQQPVEAKSNETVSPEKKQRRLSRRFSRRELEQKNHGDSGTPKVSRKASVSRSASVVQVLAPKEFDMAKIGNSLIAGTHVLQQLLTDSTPEVSREVYKMLDEHNVLPSLVLLLVKQQHEPRFVWQFLNLLISIAEFPTVPASTKGASSTAWGSIGGGRSLPPSPTPAPKAPHSIDWKCHAVVITKTLLGILEEHSLGETPNEELRAARGKPSDHGKMSMKEQFKEKLEQKRVSLEAQHTEEQIIFKKNCVRSVARLMHRMITTDDSVAQLLINPRLGLFDVLTKLLEEPQPQQGEETMILATECLLCEVRLMQPYLFRVFGKRGPTTPMPLRRHLESTDFENTEMPVRTKAACSIWHFHTLTYTLVR